MKLKRKEEVLIMLLLLSHWNEIFIVLNCVLSSFVNLLCKEEDTEISSN